MRAAYIRAPRRKWGNPMNMRIIKKSSTPNQSKRMKCLQTLSEHKTAIINEVRTESDEQSRMDVFRCVQ